MEGLLEACRLSGFQSCAVLCCVQSQRACGVLRDGEHTRTQAQLGGCTGASSVLYLASGPAADGVAVTAAVCCACVAPVLLCRSDVDPEQAVALGAAIQAAVLLGLSSGVELMDGSYVEEFHNRSTGFEGAGGAG